MYKSKSLALFALAILFGGLFISAEAQKRRLPPIYIDPPPVFGAELSGTYVIAVNANELSTGEVEPTTQATYGWTCYGVTKGDLSGFLFVSMNYSSDYSFAGDASLSGVSSVSGGSWSKLIFIDGEYAGSVFGKIVGGELVRNKLDRTAAINLQLSSDGGTGLYVGTIGNGTFAGVLDQNLKAPSVSGKLILNY